MKKIGFIGLGHMGQPMVHNLIKAGYEVIVFDISVQAIEQCMAFGAGNADSLIALAKQVDIAITMLQTGEQISKVCLGAEGLFANLAKNSLYIDCSSIDINACKMIHAAAEKAGIAMVEAPVSGGVAGAQAASLTIMVGGSEKNYLRAKHVLRYLGNKVIHAGNSGSGQAAKICNNLLLAISMIGTCEAFNLAKKLDLDPKKFFDIASNASSQCWSMTSYCPEPNILKDVPSSNNYQPGFTSQMMLKDVRLAKNAAESAGAHIPLGELSEKLYQSFVEQGGGEKDFSGIMEFLKA